MGVQIELYPVKRLRLDPLNPRLPEALHNKNQSEILRYLYENGSLDELAQSFLDNGFFAHEPLIILHDRGDKSFIVLEGNRRLAALMILFQAPEAEGLGFAGLEPDEKQLQALADVPCYLIKNREDVHTFLGFRHIGGIKTWSAEAKARYLLAEVDRAVKQGSTDPFKDVGRRVGSNALGVRNPYIAIRILQLAREEFGIDTAYVQLHRFGVWLRGMNSEEIREHVGFGTAKTYAEVKKNLKDINNKGLAEVLSDLTPQKGQRQALLADSRDVTDYGRILANKRAYAALRKHRDLAIAKQIVEELDLPIRIQRLTESCRVLVDELHFADVDKDVLDAVEDLSSVVRSIFDIVKARAKGK